MAVGQLLAVRSAPIDVAHQLVKNASASGGPVMTGKKDKQEDVVLKARQAEVQPGQRSTIADTVRQVGVTVHLISSAMAVDRLGKACSI